MALHTGRWYRRLHSKIYAWLWTVIALTLLASAAAAKQPPASQSHLRRRRRTESDNGDNEQVFPVLIGLRRAYSRSSRLSVILRFSSKFPHRRFRRINVVSGSVTQAERDRLANHPDVVYIEDDALVYPSYVEQQVTSTSTSSTTPTADALLYGISMVQGDSTIIPSVTESTAATSAACNDPNSFKIGVRTMYTATTALRHHVCFVWNGWLTLPASKNHALIMYRLLMLDWQCTLYNRCTLVTVDGPVGLKDTSLTLSLTRS
jgi:hypothetical protein